MVCSLLLLTMGACKKDGTQIVAGNGTAPVLSTTATSLVLNKDNAADTIITFNWTTSSFGYQGGVSYALQADIAGNNFKDPAEISLGVNLAEKFTVADLNALAISKKLVAGKTGQLEVRIKAYISDNYTPAYSNVQTITLLPYAIAVSYPALYVIGSYEGWDGANASTIVSVASDQDYEGYINFPDAGTEFKFTSAPDFTHINYGYVSAGVIVAGGGGNIAVTDAGYYLLKANTKTLTYSVTKTTWAVTGDAAGSAAAEAAMSYDATTKVWTLTRTLTAGSFKFRANQSDALTLGDNETPDGKLKYGGNAIPVAAAGNYKITLDLSVPGNYAYSLAAQ